MTFTFPIETQDQKALIGCGVAFSLLPAVVVYLRILARHKANRPIDTSDYLIVISCVCWKPFYILKSSERQKLTPLFSFLWFAIKRLRSQVRIYFELLVLWYD